MSIASGYSAWPLLISELVTSIRTSTRLRAATLGARWIKEHIEAVQRANKLMLIKEYGFETSGANDEAGKQRRDAVFKACLSQVMQSDGAGALVWMIASVMEDGQFYPDYDHYTVYAAEDVPSICAFARVANPIQNIPNPNTAIAGL